MYKYIDIDLNLDNYRLYLIASQIFCFIHKIYIKIHNAYIHKNIYVHKNKSHANFTRNMKKNQESVKKYNHK